MSIHVCCDWDGVDALEDRHISAIVDAMRANRAMYKTRWAPPAFVMLGPADVIMWAASGLLDDWDGPPSSEQIEEMLALIPDNDFCEHARDALARIYARLETMHE
jgi:hypothetical protein